MTIAKVCTQDTRSPALLEPEGGWLHLPAGRIPVPTGEQAGRLFAAATRFKKQLGWKETPALFPLFHQHSGLFWPWLLFASRLMPFGTLPAPLREQVILRVAWNRRCRYEWGQHIQMGLQSGLSDQQLWHTTLPSSDRVLDEPTRTLLKAVDQQCEQGYLEDSVWDSLNDRLGKRGMIELIILIGHYQMLAGLLINAGLVLEPDIEQNVEQFLQRIHTAASRSKS